MVYKPFGNYLSKIMTLHELTWITLQNTYYRCLLVSLCFFSATGPACPVGGGRWGVSLGNI